MFRVTKFDHPDLVGGIVWEECELNWINERITLAIFAEREACAKACELEHVGVDVWDYCNYETDEAYNRALRDGAAAIRERSNIS